MEIIGFATQFYTLWNVNTYPICDYKGKQIGERTQYNYIKNISKSLDEVKSNFPNTPIDMSLKGEREFSRCSYYEKEVIPYTCYQYGQYKYQEIEDVNDNSYLCWYYRNGVSEEQKTYIENLLRKKGYVCEDNRIYTDQEVKYQNEVDKYCDESNMFEFVSLTNLRSDDRITGFTYDDKFETVFFSFDEIKECYYNGYNYYLPLVNGKAKRIKNKRIRVTDFEVVPKTRFSQFRKIIVKKFEILKD